MRAGATEPSAAFYTVADSRYFPGVAAMIDSLRVLGHDEVVHVLDCGLDASQRRLLAPQATIVAAGNGQVPELHKFDLPLERPADVMVLIDADVILTRPIREIVAAAAEGRVVAFADRVPHRYFSEWGDLLGLDGVVPRTYLNTGLVAVPRDPGMDVLERARTGLGRIDVSRSIAGGGPPNYPFSYLDQDVFNAVLSALVEPGGTLVLDSRLAATTPFKDVRIVDERGLRCCYPDGVEPFALHHVEEKPWLVPTAANAYSRLLTRLVLDPAAAVPVEGDLPLRLREGPIAACARAWGEAQAAVRETWRRTRLTAHRARSRSRPGSSLPARGETR